MKVFEQILVGTALLGFLMKVMLIPGGSELLFLGCTLGALFYWSFSFATFNHIPLRAIFKKTSYANVSAGRILGSIGLGMALCTIIIGIQYRLLLLYGAAEMITVGAASLTVLLLAALLVMVFKKRALDRFYRSVLIRGGLALIIGIFALFDSGSVSIIGIIHNIAICLSKRTKTRQTKPPKMNSRNIGLNIKVQSRVPTMQPRQLLIASQ